MKKQQRLWIGGLAIVIFLGLWEAAMPLGWVKVADISRPTLYELMEKLAIPRE